MKTLFFGSGGKVTLVSLAILLGLNILLLYRVHQLEKFPQQKINDAGIHGIVTDDFIDFNIDSYNFGKLKIGDEKTIRFVCTNNGSENLLIDSVWKDCGCTNTAFPLYPLKPGKEGYVEVRFIAMDKGRFSKNVKVFFNNHPKAQILQITGRVE